MVTRIIEVRLDPTVVELYDASLTGHHDDILLAVEKTITKRLFPERVTHGLGGEQVDLDVDLIEVSAG
jgi:hypothetical protein